MCITAPADDRKGWTDGPARDPDRVTGSADRHRSRRAPARSGRDGPVPGPASPARADRRPLLRATSHNRITSDERGSLPPPPRSSIRQTKRRRTSSRRRFVRVRGSATVGAASRPGTDPRLRHSAYAPACRMSVVAARRPSYGRRGASEGMPNEGSGSHGREDARGGWGRRIARSSPFDPRGAHRPRGLTPRVSPTSLADGRPADRPTIGSRPRRGLAPGQVKNNRRTIEERCSSQATGPSVP